MIVSIVNDVCMDITGNVESELECIKLVNKFFRQPNNDSKSVTVYIFTEGEMLKACELVSSVIWTIRYSGVNVNKVEMLG